MTAGVKEIEVRDLRLAYGGKEVLHGISFDVYRHEILAVIGPAQSGKSSMLRCLNRTIDFIATATVGGSVKVDGEDVRKMKDVFALRRRIGMVAPLPVGLPLTIYDNVAFAPRCSGVTRRAELDPVVERCLRQAALWDEVKDRLEEPGTGLSGGQQQRLCIARALGNQPDILLMDEPCSALDPIATQKVEELIFELKAAYTIMIVTHNMQQAARVSDVTAFFDRGELIETGDTERVFTTPANERTEAYITGRFG